MSNVSIGGRNALLTAIKTALDGGFISIYSGPVPTNPEDALSGNTELVKITAGDDGVTGITFDAPSTGAMNKAAVEDWLCEITTSGTATFYRHYDATDNPVNASGSKFRIQGTCGVAGSGADMILATVALVANGTNKTGPADYTLYED